MQDSIIFMKHLSEYWHNNRRDIREHWNHFFSIWCKFNETWTI